MKKYFLLMMLMTVVFLGLGNMAVGQQLACQCESDGNGYVQDSNIDCTFLGSGWLHYQNKCECKYGNEILTCTDTFQPIDVVQLNNDCNVETITTDNMNSVTQTDQGCCTEDGVVIEGLPACTQEQIDTIANTPSSCKANERLNTFGICVCEDGYKEINDVCVSCATEGVCCGISLNTSIPFIGDCIEDDKNSQGVDETNVTGETAFPVLMGSLTKILVSVILIISFVLIVVGGIMIATGDPAGGKKMIIKVVIGIALLGASGVILRLINPNFFG